MVYIVYFIYITFKNKCVACDMEMLVFLHVLAYGQPMLALYQLALWVT